jgi:hypothetical protein
MAEGVDAAVEAVEPAGANPVRNAPSPEAEFEQLRASDHSPLPPRELPQRG